MKEQTYRSDVDGLAHNLRKEIYDQSEVLANTCREYDGSCCCVGDEVFVVGVEVNDGVSVVKPISVKCEHVICCVYDTAMRMQASLTATHCAKLVDAHLMRRGVLPAFAVVGVDVAQVGYITVFTGELFDGDGKQGGQA